MISEEDKTRIKDAVVCSNCLDWHKHCKSECCRIIYVGSNVEELNKDGKFIKVKANLNYDQKWYYVLRDVKYVHGQLLFLKERCINSQGRLLYVHDCSFLKDMLCEGHLQRKPELCRNLREFGDAKKLGAFITDNCLFKYKEMIKNAEKD